MTRFLRSCVLLLTGAAAAALGASVALGASGSATSSSTATTSATSFVQVSAREYRYNLSRRSVRRGKVTFELVNHGEDEHDLAVKRRAGGVRRTTRVLQPGERTKLSMRLRPGKYDLWCTISDHRARGMKAVLRVKS